MMRKVLHPVSYKVHLEGLYRHWTACGHYIYHSPGVAADIPVTCKNCKRMVKPSPPDDTIQGG